MPLAPGTKLGPYEILSPLGAGGMGEVYRANDTRLGRTVAVKILPESLAKNPEARQRFEREARSISSLNHPNICALYDVGMQDGTSYLVMEFIQGETLESRLQKGPLPVKQALEYGTQICDALEKAHRAGIAHRDLKPANIMLTATGAKLLDFGLAKPVASILGGQGKLGEQTPSSPTINMTALTAAPEPLTQRGLIVGTFQFMAPEVLQGKEADARGDIFSLGCVLYEMVTGKHAFGGKSQISVMSAILEKQPDSITMLQPAAPPALDYIVHTCLEKDPDKRFQTAHDVKLQLAWIAKSGSQTTAAAIAPPAPKRAWLWGIAGALAAIALGLGFFVGTKTRHEGTFELVRLTADIGADTKLNSVTGVAMVVAPDGTRVAFSALGPDGKSRLYVRPLNQLQATQLSGTDDGRNPFFSPDSQWLGYFAAGKLKKISVQGGAAVTLCDVPMGRGGSWSQDGTIVYSPGIRAALLAIPAAGGTPQPLMTLDTQSGEATQRWPQFLPGDQSILFVSNTHGANYEDASIVVYSIPSKTRKVLVRGGYFGRYLSSGHLLYMHDGTLFAVPFDTKRMEATGSPTPVLDGLTANPGDASAQYSIADNGTLVYVPGRAKYGSIWLYWLDKQGKYTPVQQPPGDYYSPSFSPDGKHLALTIQEGGERSDVWLYDCEKNTLTRLTFGGNNQNPIWTPDGKNITYVHFEKAAVGKIYSIRADGAGNPVALASVDDRIYPTAWHPSGKLLVLDRLGLVDNQNVPRILTLDVDGAGQPGAGELKPFLTSSYWQGDSSLSPDGRWIAYDSNESGEYQVYVRSLSGAGGKWQVSTAGGRYPKWSRSGRELFYNAQDTRAMMVAPYTVSGDSFSPGNPQVWSPAQISDLLGTASYDINPDGKRFIVLKTTSLAEDAAPDKFGFVFNFLDDVRRVAPAGK